MAVALLLSLVAVEGVVVFVLAWLGNRLPFTAVPVLGEVTVLLNVGDLDRPAALLAGAASVVVFLPLAIGFWRLRRVAWVGTMLMSAVTLTVHVIAWLLGDPAGRDAWNGVNLAIPIAMVLYLNRRDVQRRFGAPDPERPAATVLVGDES